MESKYAVELDEFGWYNYIMFYRRRSVFCRVWLNSKTFTHTDFLTHANHATNAKILTHATHAQLSWTHAVHTKISTHATHAKILWTHAKIWPTPLMHPRYPRHPRDLADLLQFHWHIYRYLNNFAIKEKTISDIPSHQTKTRFL